MSPKRVEVFRDKLVPDPRDDDIVILVMGRMGAGKSTFINEYTGSNAAVVHGYRSDGNNIDWYTAGIPNIPEFEELQDRRLILVDTLGLDDMGDSQPATKRLTKWLASTYKSKKTFIGILFLVDISEKRCSYSATNVKVFKEICGDSDDAFRKIVIGTTQWDSGAITDEAVAAARETSLQTKYWNDVVDKGAVFMRNQVKPQDQEEIVKYFVRTCMQVGSCLTPSSSVDESRIGGVATTAFTKLQRHTAWQKQMKEGDRVMEIASPSDLVIMVMGPTGVGKSTFINNYLDGVNATAQVGHQLGTCTRHLDWFTKDLGPESVYPGRRLVLVDTPGFDDTYGDESDILRRIGVWLSSSYVKGMTLAGVIYLHDIKQRRIYGSSQMNLSVFEHLIGPNAFPTVALVTNQWDTLNDSKTDFVNREAQLKSIYWAKAIQDGATVMRVEGEDSNKKIIETVLMRHFKAGAERRVLLIQKELVEKDRFIPMTKAGQQLRYTLQELLEFQRQLAENAQDDQKRRELSEKVVRTKQQLEVLSVSLKMRLTSWINDIFRTYD